MLEPHTQPEGDERWIYIARRHWMAFLWRIGVPLGVIAVALGIIVVRALTRTPDFLGRVAPLVDPFVGLLLLSILFMLLAIAYIYFDWQNDLLILSNKRVIFEDRTLFMSFRTETIPLERVQNVNTRSEGLQKLLGYGMVSIQASGPSAPIIFNRVMLPGTVQKEIMKEVGREKREQEDSRLRAAIHKRVNPGAPPLVVPQVPIERDLPTTTSGLGALLPFGPLLLNGTVIWHRHWVVLISKLLWPLLALLVWIGLLVGLPTLGAFSTLTLTLILFVGLVFVLGFFGWQIANWRNDVYMLDPGRIVDISRLPLGLFEDRREASLGAIQNVNSTSPNLLARWLGYGNVVIETAGAAGNFTFTSVPNPAQVQRMIFEYVDRFKWNQREREWNNALTIVEAYMQVKQPPPPPPPSVPPHQHP